MNDAIADAAEAPANPTRVWQERIRAFSLTPGDIAAELGKRVMSQDAACRTMSTLIRQHIRRLQTRIADGSWDGPATATREIRPTLLIGPPGVGKSLLVATAARLACVPSVREDCSAVTAVGWEGRSVNNILEALILQAGAARSIARAGIVFLDELDKIRQRTSSTFLDVGGAGCQRSLLGLIEGAVVQVEHPPSAPRPSRVWVPFPTVDLLVVMAGAFEGLERIVAQRLGVDGRRIGFSGVGDRREDGNRASLLARTTPDDLITYGMIPELVSRLGQVVVLQELGRDDLRRILLDAEDGPLSLQRRLLGREGVTLDVSDDAVEGIVEEALTQGLGARSLHAVLARVLQRVHFDLPGRKGGLDGAGCVVRLEGQALADGSYVAVRRRKRARCALGR